MMKKIIAQIPNSVKSNLLSFIPGNYKDLYWKFRRQVLWEIGKRTPSIRALPDFLVIGAQKSGTSTMFRYLTLHPQIYGSVKKEVHFFDRNYGKGVNWYRSHFPMRKKLKNGCITGEASPCYLMFPHAAERISQLLPEVKLIILLRNPVDRAVSHYFHEVRGGRENLPIDEALEAEENRIRPELIKLQQDKTYHSISYRNYSYKMRGVYIDQIKSYLQFFNRNKLYIIKSEEFFENPLATLKGLFAFLEVDESFIPRVVKPSKIGKYTDNQFDGAKQKLRTYFDPHNKKLYEFVGRDFNW